MSRRNVRQLILVLIAQRVKYSLTRTPAGYVVSFNMRHEDRVMRAIGS